MIASPDVKRRWGTAGAAAIVSLLTMPLTAIWFLLIGGLLLVSSLVVAAVRDARVLGLAGFIGIGLLVGPAIYLGLAALQG